MRLSTPFVRLPLRFDAHALAAEVAGLPAEVWRPHPEGAPGNTAVALVCVDGDPDNDSTRGPMAPSPHLELLPRLRRVLAGLDTLVGRTRLMRIEEEGELQAHVDTNYYWRDHLRVHLPIVTSPDVRFACDGVEVCMGPGEVWVFDTWRQHHVVNPVEQPRVHLVVDTVGSRSLWDLVEHPDAEVRTLGEDPPGGAVGPELLTEAVNFPEVMTPWEADRALDALLAELQVGEPEVAARLAAALGPWRHSWRAAWAQFGDDARGVPAFLELRDEADAIVADVGGSSRLPNRVPVVEAVRQHVLRPAVAPAPDVPGPSRSVPPPGRPARPSLDRPVFVVSSPRSGSTLYFETLARARDLFTTGGENHHTIERIPGLHPSAHGWGSNRLDAEDANPAAVAALTDTFVAQLRDRDGRPPGPGPVRMLEKTPKNALRVPFLAAAYPDAIFVYLYRDPRETVSSMLDAWKSGRFVTYPELDGWDGPPWSLLLVPGWRELSGRPLAEVVTTQFATATTMLLDDLEALDPDRWFVASYDRLVDDPQAEVTRACQFADLEFDEELSTPLPLSRHTVDSPHPDKWLRNADELEPHWDRVRDVARRAHDVFAEPPRVRPVPRRAPASAPAGTPGPAPASAPAPAGRDEAFRSVHTTNFAPILEQLGCSLLVSTYQTGRVIVVRSDGRGANTHFCAFDQPMGLAARGTDLAIGTKTQILAFQNQPAVGERLEPPGRVDACFVPRRAHTTGDIRVHDIAFAGDELWLVNTRFSCLATLDDAHSFVPRWRPPFVTALAPEDRCHLNGLAVVDGAPRFVTALGRTDTEGGWREGKDTGGVLLDVPSGEPVVTGLCMPHSPRWHDGRLWVLESGTGTLAVVDVAAGTTQEVARVPGFARGLAFVGPFAFVGLSQVREHVFEGLPLTADGVERTCGVWVVDVRTGQIAAFLRFEGLVQEIYEVAALTGVRFPEILDADVEAAQHAYVLPPEALADVPADRRS